jgi:ABC-type polysaccharide/polyol phosphate transport system ATPase subunit
MAGAPEPGVAIRADTLHKTFRIPHEAVHTLKERALHPLRQRTFDELRALDGVSVDVRRGEFFGIVGRNGSGKTTLMKCLAGIYRLDDGEIWVRGRLAPFIELGVGFNPELTARDNVLINAIMFGLTPAQANERYDSIIEFAELERFVNLKLKNYSSGMQVRLAFAVMTHVDADVLLIDEVLAVGDSSFQRKCQEALLAAQSRGTTIVLVTHDMNAVQRFCNRAMLVDRGRVVSIGEPGPVARAYEDLNRGRLDGSPAVHTGDGSAAIDDVWVEGPGGARVESVEHGTPCSVVIRVAFRQPVERPQFGVVLSDEWNRPVFAATTAWRHRDTGTFGAGQRVEVRLELENLLAAGSYLVSPEVIHDGSPRRVIDHRENAARFDVSGGRQGAGIVDLPHEFALHRLEALETTGDREHRG